jgi:Fe2+ or Zn2+ uptake regulation protein
LTEQFRSRGLKVTPQRQSIFRALERLDGAHPSADAVYALVSAEMPTISLKTVYQTLNDLASMGELVQLDLGTGAMRFDAELEPHHHVVCERCGAVRDVRVNLSTTTLPRELSGRFTVTSTEVVFRGTCADCEDVTPEPAIVGNEHHHHQRRDEHA